MGTLPNRTNRSPLSTANTFQNNLKYCACFTRGAEMCTFPVQVYRQSDMMVATTGAS